METTRDEIFARRREQNRLAQRRFRLKQSQQKAAVKADQSERSVRQPDQTTPSNPTRQEPHNDLRPLSPTEPPVDHAPAASSCALMGLFGNYTLLDPVNLDNLFSQHNSSRTTDQSQSPAFDDMSTMVPGDRESSYFNLQSPYIFSSPLETPEARTADTTLSPGIKRASQTFTKESPRGPSKKTQSPLDHNIIAQRDGALGEVPNVENAAVVTNKGGWLSPLHSAAQKGHDRIVRVLLQYQANCDEKDSDGLTSMMHAIVSGSEDVVSSLLEHGARVTETDSEGRMALHWVVLHRRETLLKCLLQHCGEDRAVIDSHDNSGKTPLHMAIDDGFEAAVHLLLQYGANPNSKARKS